MSIDHVAAVLRADVRPASHKLALVMLAEGTNMRTGVVWRSRASIAACVGITPRAAHRVMQDLESRGLVEVVGTRAGGSRGAVNVYRVSLSKLAELTPEVVHTGDIQATPTGGSAVTPERVEGWPTGAPRGGLQATQTGIEPSIQAPPVDNSTGAACVALPNSRSPEEGQTKAPAFIGQLLAGYRREGLLEQVQAHGHATAHGSPVSSGRTGV